MGWESNLRAVAGTSWKSTVVLPADDVTLGDLRAALAALDTARAEAERLRTAAADERADVVAWMRRQGWSRASYDIRDGAHVGAAKGGDHG